MISTVPDKPFGSSDGKGSYITERELKEVYASVRKEPERLKISRENVCGNRAADVTVNEEKQR